MNRQAKQLSKSGFREIYIYPHQLLQIPATVAIRKIIINIDRHSHGFSGFVDALADITS